MDFFNETRNLFLKSVFFVSRKKCRTSWFTACVFRETVTTFVVCSVRVATLTEHTMNHFEMSHRVFVPKNRSVKKTGNKLIILIN